jgi:hypothetical protein
VRWVTVSNRGAAQTSAQTSAQTPAPAGESQEPNSGESVRLIWPDGGQAAGDAEGPRAARPGVQGVQGAQGVRGVPGDQAGPGAGAGADPDDLPIWGWSSDESEPDDPSDAFAPDRPEYPDGPDYPDYRPLSGADPSRVTPGTEGSRRPGTSGRDQGLRRPREPAVITTVAAQADEPRREGIGQHLGSLGHLAANPRRRAWLWRAVVAAVIVAGFSILGQVLVGLTLAVLVVIADTIIRSRMALIRGHRNAARRRTRRQLRRLERAGYHALHGVPIPGSEEQIDHLVIGPAGVFSIDSEAWDRRLPVRTRKGTHLWHGPFSMKHRLDHAQWESEQASARLSAALGTQVTVRPAMAIYGPRIPWDVAIIRDIDVFSGPKLRRYLRGVARQADTRLLSDGEIERIDRATYSAFPKAAAR